MSNLQSLLSHFLDRLSCFGVLGSVGGATDHNTGASDSYHERGRLKLLPLVDPLHDAPGLAQS